MTKTGTNALTKAVIQYLNLNGFRAWRNNNGGVYSVARKAFLKNPSAVAGIPDILGFYTGTKVTNGLRRGVFIGVEIKGTPKDRISPAQALFLRSLSDAGGIAIVARSFDQFRADFHDITQTDKPRQFSNGLRLKDPSKICLKP